MLSPPLLNHTISRGLDKTAGNGRPDMNYDSI